MDARNVSVTSDSVTGHIAIGEGLDLTQYQAMRQMRESFGINFRYDRERILAVEYVASVQQYKIGILTVKIIQRASCDTVTHQGARFVCISAETGSLVSDETIWIKLPEPVIMAGFMVKYTPQRVQADRLAFMICDRPGAESWVGGSASRMGQIDSYARECQGVTSRNKKHLDYMAGKYETITRRELAWQRAIILADCSNEGLI